MDKNAIKKFAVWARTELIARVSLNEDYNRSHSSGFGWIGYGKGLCAERSRKDRRTV